MINIENAKDVFEKYIGNYDLKNGKIDLKARHIRRVSQISEKIARSLQLSEEDVNLAILIGLLHDIGRFEQVKRYNTFYDSKSVNHGEFGVRILFEEGLIEKFNIDKKYYKTIRLAILNHNRNRIEDGLSEDELLHCKIIRDSDKLDIFYVLLTDKIIDAYGCESMSDETFTDEIVREFYEDHLINYKNMNRPGDLWIAHMAYIYDFNFKSSYETVKENNYINRLFERVNFQDKKTRKDAEKIVATVNEYIENQIKNSRRE